MKIIPISDVVILPFYHRYPILRKSDFRHEKNQRSEIVFDEFSKKREFLVNFYLLGTLIVSLSVTNH